MFVLGDGVRVSVPASSGNLGCGFDTFGAAIDLWLTLEVQVCQIFSFTSAATSQQLTLFDENTALLPRDSSNIIVKGFNAALSHLEADQNDELQFSFNLTSNAIPIGRGLGSSAAAIVAGMGAAYALVYGGELSEDALREIAMLACQIEGHPDNVLPAIFGGVQIVVPTTLRSENATKMTRDWKDLIARKVPFPHSHVSLILHIPDEGLATSEARSLLPSEMNYLTISANIGRSALFVSSLLLRDFKLLSASLEDGLHEPYREKLCPLFGWIKRHCKESGAYGAHLSGAGPSTIIWCPPHQSQIVAGNLCEANPELMEQGRFVFPAVTESGLRVKSMTRRR